MLIAGTQVIPRVTAGGCPGWRARLKRNLHFARQKRDKFPGYTFFLYFLRRDCRKGFFGPVPAFVSLLQISLSICFQSAHNTYNEKPRQYLTGLFLAVKHAVVFPAATGLSVGWGPVKSFTPRHHPHPKPPFRWYPVPYHRHLSAVVVQLYDRRRNCVGAWGFHLDCFSLTTTTKSKTQNHLRFPATSIDRRYSQRRFNIVQNFIM